MPKKRISRTTRGGHKAKGDSIRRKFRIGNRKTGRSGHSISTSELLEIAETADRRRDRFMAKKVLYLRGAQ